MRQPTSTLQQALDEIIYIHEKWQRDWQDQSNWGPQEVDDASLDLHAEMARNLKNLVIEPDASVTRAHLMCCWTTLGSMIESALTFFLSVYVHDHHVNHQSVNAVKASKQPDDNKLHKLRHIFAEVVWLPQQKTDFDAFVEQVREKRNQIHSFKTKTLGAMNDFRECVVKYRNMISDLDGQLPPSQPDSWE